MESRRFGYSFLIAMLVVIAVFAVFFFRSNVGEGTSSAFWSVLVFLLLLFGVIGVSLAVRHKN